ncbi:hypothetical protein ACJX0J_029564 [Zea mays]
MTTTRMVISHIFHIATICVRNRVLFQLRLAGLESQSLLELFPCAWITMFQEIKSNWRQDLDCHNTHSLQSQTPWSGAQKLNRKRDYHSHKEIDKIVQNMPFDKAPNHTGLQGDPLSPLLFIVYGKRMILMQINIALLMKHLHKFYDRLEITIEFLGNMDFQENFHAPLSMEATEEYLNEIWKSNKTTFRIIDNPTKKARASEEKNVHS